MISDDHPITPPPELVKQWVSLACEYEGDETWIDLATQAARWGAGEQLAICLKWLQGNGYETAADDLKEHCRPFKPQPPKTVVVDGHTYHLAE